MWCVVLRSNKKADTYLYLPESAEFDDLPENLKVLFKSYEQVMKLYLKEDKKLARITGAELIKHLQEPGYYLQLPPVTENLLKQHAANNKE
ncbi:MULTISPECIES: YcgL domain-containing protein [Gammaproteobacteria]|uniref:YcgL domain-containing protein n=1 Tax=Gammaproteobacteria TaxID=1236 RepID=UPI000DCF7C30|nr:MULTISPECIES: YcgL domain-containing protein [Gammaproteobacteria]RTE87604.1 hypothetical protein DQX04_04350 [Aliidiomarina sp. B3213]TCZ92611.1 hypothetical protein EYQ95_00945 [Lysobacter sp. N42]